MSQSNPVLQILQAENDALIDDWVKEQMSADTVRADLLQSDELHAQSREFLAAFRTAIASGEPVKSAAWDPVRGILAEISRERTRRGFSTTEIATFVFSLKQPLFNKLLSDLKDPKQFGAAVWMLTTTIDALGLFTTEIYQSAREELISRQQQDMLELSTPVVKLWDGILALPMIGTLDSNRAQVVMETLLQTIVSTGAEIAILDITGVPTVDTLVAQHLLKTVTAARLMGADCIISGIRPQIAQTIVHLGVDLEDVITKASLADAFKLAMQRRRLRVVSMDAPSRIKSQK